MRCRDGRRWRRAFVALAVALLTAAAATACTAPDPKLSTAVREVRMTSAHGQAELVLMPPGNPTKVVIFMHGFDSDQQQLLTTPGLFAVRDALLAAGYALATSDAHGDNVGNPASLADQVDLMTDVGKVVPTIAQLDVIGFSMGGLDALLAASAAPTVVHSVVLLSPVTDQTAFLDTHFESAIASAFADVHAAGLAQATTASNPSRKAAASFKGPRYHFWHSDADTVVPVEQSLSMVARLKAAGVDASFSSLDGDHGDLAELDPATVVAFMEQT